MADLSIGQCSNDIAQSWERFVDVLGFIQHWSFSTSLAYLVNSNFSLCYKLSTYWKLSQLVHQTRFCVKVTNIFMKN